MVGVAEHRVPPPLGGGRPIIAPEHRRASLIRVCLTRSELEALVVLADAWSVPVGTAAYGLLADRLCEARNAGARLPGGLVEAASRMVLETPRAGPPVGPTA